MTTDKKLKFKSPAEFFANNKNIAGFDNPGKSLCTTVRELVENSLDASESIGVLPFVQISIEEFSLDQFNSLMGLQTSSRVNAHLYSDFNHPKAAKKGKIATPTFEEINEMSPDSNKGRCSNIVTPLDDTSCKSSNGKDSPKQLEELQKSKLNQGIRKSPPKKTMYYRVTVRDNGSGMAHNDVPNMLGRVLAGTKYGVKQARGRFGLGAKMALIWSKMSTGLPIHIVTASPDATETTICELDIDIIKNLPSIRRHETIPNIMSAASAVLLSESPVAASWLERETPDEKFSGSVINITIEGQMTTYRKRLLQYMRQMAVITPYAEFEFHFISQGEAKSFAIRYARRSSQMPRLPTEVKYHPSSVDLLTIKQLQDSSSRDLTIVKYLSTQFSSIDAKLAQQIVIEMAGCDDEGNYINDNFPVSELTEVQLMRLLQLFKTLKFSVPSGICLSPIGEYNLRLGIMKELQPDMVATFQEATHIFEGHPFIVEAGVSLGGKSVNMGLNVYRFANRIPLLFEGGSDVVTRTVQRINWSSYKIRHNQDKIGIFVSIVSTKIPFKGTGKEYIGDDAVSIANAVKHAIMQCCSQLRNKLAQRADMISKRERAQNLSKYIPNVSKAIHSLLYRVSTQPAMKRPKLSATDDTREGNSSSSTFRVVAQNEREDLLSCVKTGDVTEAILRNKLTVHIEQSTASEAFEYTVKQREHGNSSRIPIHIAPFSWEGRNTAVSITSEPTAQFFLLEDAMVREEKTE